MDEQDNGAAPEPLGKKAPGYDKEKRENVFRNMTASPWSTGKTIGAVIAVIFGLALLGTGGIGILIGLGLIGAVGWVIYVRVSGKDLEMVPAETIALEQHTAVAACRPEALEVLHLDEDDIVQSVTLTGGAGRDLIEGRRRDFFGQIRPDPLVHWRPWVRDEAGKPVITGRIQIHNIFALQDGIAYHSKQYDLVDGDFVDTFVDGSNEVVSGYATNKIYYRNVENVRMSDESLELHMGSGRRHSFGLTIPKETIEKAGQAQGKGDDAAAEHKLAIDESMRREGKAFEAAVNQLRDEWERRANPVR